VQVLTRLSKSRRIGFHRKKEKPTDARKAKATDVGASVAQKRGVSFDARKAMSKVSPTVLRVNPALMATAPTGARHVWSTTRDRHCWRVSPPARPSLKGALSEQNSKYLERPSNRSDRPGKMQENQWPRNPVLTFWQSKRICSDNARSGAIKMVLKFLCNNHCRSMSIPF